MKSFVQRLAIYGMVAVFAPAERLVGAEAADYTKTVNPYYEDDPKLG